MPATYYRYLQGPGEAYKGNPSSGQPGFGRYLRVTMTQAENAEVTFEVKALLKP